MSQSNIAIVNELLAGATDPAVVGRLVADHASYISLTFDNPHLTSVMPWAGTHQDGKAAILKTFIDVNRFWSVEAFVPQYTFGDGEMVAVFGTFTLRSTKLGKRFESPFAVLAQVQGGKVVHMRYMEDTFGTGETFRSGGEWRFESDPDGGEVVV